MATLQQRIGLKTKHLRMEKHLAAKAFAAMVGWQPDYLSRFEQGKWRLADPGKLICVADALEVSLDELAGRNGEPASPEKSGDETMT